MSMPTPTLSATGKASLDSLSKKTVETGFPAAFLGVANVQDIVYKQQDGWVDMDDKSKGPVDDQTILHLFSMTKATIGVALLQLIDQGLLTEADLDDPATLARVIPELSMENLQIFEGYNEEGKPTLRKATRAITLRMLMTHTAGFAYPFTKLGAQKQIARYLEEIGISTNSAGATFDNYCKQPLLYEPGTSYAYSPAIDIAGEFIARLSKKPLDVLLQTQIFDPLGLESLTFYPTPAVKARLMRCVYLDPEDNKMKLYAKGVFPRGRPSEPEQVTFIGGGGGLYGTSVDYLKFLQAIIRCDPRAPQDKIPTAFRLLSPDSYALLFQPSMPSPSSDNNCLEELCWQHNADPEQCPLDVSPDNLQHGIGFCLLTKPGARGRNPGSGHWSGAAKTMYWLDPKGGIVAVFGTQAITTTEPFGSLYYAFESTVYKSLE